jgi:hypothetical protein
VTDFLMPTKAPMFLGVGIATVSILSAQSGVRLPKLVIGLVGQPVTVSAAFGSYYGRWSVSVGNCWAVPHITPLLR